MLVRSPVYPMSEVFVNEKRELAGVGRRTQASPFSFGVHGICLGPVTVGKDWIVIDITRHLYYECQGMSGLIAFPRR